MQNVQIAAPEHCNPCSPVAYTLGDNCDGHVFYRTVTNPDPDTLVTSMTIVENGALDDQIFLMAMTLQE